MKYYIADTHFFPRKRILTKDGRQFDNGHDMNQHLIRCWNDKVTDQDEVYIIGDFSMGSGLETSNLARSLKGRKHLIVGNHDRYLKEEGFDSSCFESISSYLEIKDQDKRVILCHYPVLFYPGQYKMDQEGNYITYMLYGHLHNTSDEDLMGEFQEKIRSEIKFIKFSKTLGPTPCQMINCFCMFSDYEPLSLEEWIRLDQSRQGR